MDPSIVIAALALGGVAVEAWRQRRKDKSESEVNLTEMIDARIAREFRAMEGEISSLRARVLHLEIELDKANQRHDAAELKAAEYLFLLTSHGIDPETH